MILYNNGIENFFIFFFPIKAKELKSATVFLATLPYFFVEGEKPPRGTDALPWRNKLKNLKMKAARVARDMSQEKLAAKIGVTRQTILMIEAGKYNPSLGLCIDICRALGTTLDDLFWQEDNNA